jgi:hypothetical protein
MLRDQPELTSDMRVAAACLRAFLDLAVTLDRLEVDVGESPWKSSPQPGEAK